MEQEDYVLTHRGHSHRVTVEERHKGRVMRIFDPTGERNVLTGLSKFEDSREAARSMIDANPSLRQPRAA